MNYFKDAWSYIHFLGSCVLAIGLFMKIVPNELAFIFAFSLGMLWECLDQMNKYFQWDIWLLDPTGWDIRDAVMDLIGILLSIWILSGVL